MKTVLKPALLVSLALVSTLGLSQSKISLRLAENRQPSAIAFKGSGEWTSGVAIPLFDARIGSSFGASLDALASVDVATQDRGFVGLGASVRLSEGPTWASVLGVGYTIRPREWNRWEDGKFGLYIGASSRF